MRPFLSVAQVRGPVVQRWVDFLRGAYTRKFAGRFSGFGVDEAALRAYADLDGVPDSIVHSAVAAGDDAEAARLQQVCRAAEGRARCQRCADVLDAC